MLNDKKDQQYVKDQHAALMLQVYSFGVKTKGNERFQMINKTSNTYKAVQAAGKKYGCWECSAKMGSSGAAAWVMDHIPPSGLSKSQLGKIVDEMVLQYPTRKAVQSWADYRAARRRAVPSCHDCSVKQSKLVKYVRRMSKPVKSRSWSRNHPCRNAQCCSPTRVGPT